MSYKVKRFIFGSVFWRSKVEGLYLVPTFFLAELQGGTWHHMGRERECMFGRGMSFLCFFSLIKVTRIYYGDSCFSSLIKVTRIHYGDSNLSNPNHFSHGLLKTL
jgi:hypothetical protein